MRTDGRTDRYDHVQKSKNLMQILSVIAVQLDMFAKIFVFHFFCAHSFQNTF